MGRLRGQRSWKRKLVNFRPRFPSAEPAKPLGESCLERDHGSPDLRGFDPIRHSPPVPIAPCEGPYRQQLVAVELEEPLYNGQLENFRTNEASQSRHQMTGRHQISRHRFHGFKYHHRDGKQCERGIGVEGNNPGPDPVECRVLADPSHKWPGYIGEHCVHREVDRNQDETYWTKYATHRCSSDGRKAPSRLNCSGRR